MHGRRFAVLAVLFLATTIPATAQAPSLNPANARLGQTLGGLPGPGFSLAYQESIGMLAAGCEHGLIPYWDKSVTQGIRTGDGTPAVLAGHQGPVLGLAWGGPVLASAGAEQKVILWSMPEGKPLHTLTPGSTIRALAVTPEGKLLAGAGEDSAIQLWDVASGQPTARLTGHTDWVLALAFSPDGKFLASGGCDGVVRLWEVASGKKLLDIASKPPPAPKMPPGPVNTVVALAFAPDGKTLALGGFDMQVHLVNPADGKIVRSLQGHTGGVTGLAFHPGGTLLASASKDRTVRLWNPANGQAVKALEGHTAWVQGVAFVAGGTRLASVGADQTVRLWELK
jgi:WD40 repeat protein